MVRSAAAGTGHQPATCVPTPCSRYVRGFAPAGAQRPQPRRRLTGPVGEVRQPSAGSGPRTYEFSGFAKREFRASKRLRGKRSIRQDCAEKTTKPHTVRTSSSRQLVLIWERLLPANCADLIEDHALTAENTGNPLARRAHQGKSRRPRGERADLPRRARTGRTGADHTESIDD